MKSSGWIFYLVSLVLHLVFLTVVFSLPRGEGISLEEGAKGICYVKLVEVTPPSVPHGPSSAQDPRLKRSAQRPSGLCMVERSGKVKVSRKSSSKEKEDREKVKRESVASLSPSLKKGLLRPNAPTFSKRGIARRGGEREVKGPESKIPAENGVRAGNEDSSPSKVGEKAEEVASAVSPVRIARKSQEVVPPHHPSLSAFRGSLGERGTRSGGLVVLPQVSYKVKPSYPHVAKRMGYQGRVVVRLLVSASGRVEQVKIVRSSGYRVLDKAAVKALKRWRFAPARKGGRVVPWWVEVPVVFNLERG